MNAQKQITIMVQMHEIQNISVRKGNHCYKQATETILQSFCNPSQLTFIKNVYVRKGINFRKTSLVRW